MIRIDFGKLRPIVPGAALLFVLMIGGPAVWRAAASDDKGGRTKGQTPPSEWRGIAHTQPNGDLFARTQPMFETGAAKYAWLNKVVAVGVYRPLAGKIEYQIYRIL